MYIIILWVIVQVAVEEMDESSSLVRIISLSENEEEESGVQQLQFSTDSLDIYITTEYKV